MTSLFPIQYMRLLKESIRRGEEVLFLPSRLIKNLIRGGMNLV